MIWFYNSLNYSFRPFLLLPLCLFHSYSSSNFLGWMLCLHSCLLNLRDSIEDYVISSGISSLFPLPFHTHTVGAFCFLILLFSTLLNYDLKIMYVLFLFNGEIDWGLICSFIFGNAPSTCKGKLSQRSPLSVVCVSDLVNYIIRCFIHIYFLHFICQTEKK